MRRADPADEARSRPLRLAAVAVHALLAMATLVAAARTLFDPRWAAGLDPRLAAELARAPVLAATVLLFVAATLGLVAWMLASRTRGARGASVALFLVALPPLLLWMVTGPTWAALFVLVAYGGITFAWATDPASAVRSDPQHGRTPWRPIADRLHPGGLRNILVGLIVVGVLARIVAVFTMDLQWDGATYTAMGHAWAERGTFLMPWGTLVSDTYTPQYSHHYPPLWPVWLGVHYKLLGFGAWQTHLAALVMSLLALVVVYLLTRDLYGPAAALGTTAALAVEPHLVWVTGTGFAENLVLLLFALTLWGVVRSLDRPAFVLVAGAAAGLAYLTRSSMGPFFIIAGLGGLAWRLVHRRWRVFTDVAYMAAAALFLTAVAWWAWRNMDLHGVWPWESSAYVARVLDHATTVPAMLLAAWAYKLPFFAFLLAPFVLILLPGIREGWRDVRREHESALWLAVGLVALLGWLLSGFFWTWERTSLFWSDNRRYLVIATLPLLWIALRPREGDTERPDRDTGATTRPDTDATAGPSAHAPDAHALGGRLVALCLLLLVVTVALFFVPVQVPEADAAAALDHLGPGAVVGYDGVTNRYALYPYLPHHALTVMRTDADAAPQRFDAIVSLDPDATYDGYGVLGTYTVDRWLGADRTATVWAPAAAGEDGTVRTVVPWEGT